MKYNIRGNKIEVTDSIKDYLEEFEKHHEDNLNRPIDARNIPVKYELTSVMQNRIDTIISAIEKTTSALEIAEITTLSEKDDVKDDEGRKLKAYRLVA